MTAVQRATIAPGDLGVEQTFATMADLADAGQSSPVVVGVARMLAASSADSRSQSAVATSIYQWMKGVWVYVDDPVDTELLVSPERMLEERVGNTGLITGDCDEAAILGAALGKAVGIAATFTALAFDVLDDPDRYAHVYATLLPNDGPSIDLDVTKPDGGSYATVTRTLTMAV